MFHSIHQYSRDPPLGSHSLISSLCVCARVPFVHKPSVDAPARRRRPEPRTRLAVWPLQDIVLLRSFCARINHSFIAHSHLHCPHYCNAIARLLRNIRSPPDPPLVCRAHYHIGNGNIVERPTSGAWRAYARSSHALCLAGPPIGWPGYLWSIVSACVSVRAAFLCSCEQAGMHRRRATFGRC